MDHIALLNSSIEETRKRLIAHPVYSSIRTETELRSFMQFHIYAVWDFMSLLKSLQRELTCVDLPWMPKGSANTRFLINEIVAGEESDVDEHGERISHFELYLRAMKQAGASAEGIHSLLEELRMGTAINDAIDQVVEDDSLRSFLHFTFDTINRGKVHEVAAVFTFGREDLIPDMFIEIVKDLPAATAEQFSIFKYYLERHIEVDGGHHGKLALEMLEELCGDDAQRWTEATEAAREALEHRIILWDGVMKALETQRTVNVTTLL